MRRYFDPEAYKIIEDGFEFTLSSLKMNKFKSDCRICLPIQAMRDAFSDIDTDKYVFDITVKKRKRE